jgi:carbon storage regulator CsrA
MLVINRKRGESITIGDDITVTITSVQRDCVTLDIAAPAPAVVVRKDRWLAGQSLCVGENVEIVMTGIRGQCAHVGIIAPRSMSVRRESTHDSMPSGDQVQNVVMELRGQLKPPFGGGAHS